MKLPAAGVNKMSNSVVHSITENIARDKDVGAIDLPPLHDVIDTDILEKFVQSTDETATLKFEYLQWEVTVHGDGYVETNVRQ